MEILLPIISIVSSVLSIILFFKVWQMTNDVKAIKDSTSSAKLTDKTILKLALAGEKEKAQKALINDVVEDYLALCDEILEKTQSGDNMYDYKEARHVAINEYYDSKFSEIIKRHSRRFYEYGFNLPDNLKELKYKKFTK